MTTKSHKAEERAAQEAREEPREEPKPPPVLKAGDRVHLDLPDAPTMTVLDFHGAVDARCRWFDKNGGLWERDFHRDELLLVEDAEPAERLPARSDVVPAVTPASVPPPSPEQPPATATIMNPSATHAVDTTTPPEKITGEGKQPEGSLLSDEGKQAAKSTAKAEHQAPPTTKPAQPGHSHLGGGKGK